MTKHGKSKHKDEINDERKEMKRLGFEYIGNTQDFKMPEWMECTWRRLPCGQLDCKICGRMEEDRLNHITKGEDPDSIGSVFEDVGKNFKETLELIKKDAESKGIDITNLKEIEEPPGSDTFPLYSHIMSWQEFVSKTVEKGDKEESLWLLTEAAADLSWYKNTFCAKVYRQLCNRWHMDRSDGYGEFDYKYTAYVLKECLGILKKSLAELSLLPSGQKGELLLAASQLDKLEKEILDI